MRTPANGYTGNGYTGNGYPVGGRRVVHATGSYPQTDTWYPRPDTRYEQAGEQASQVLRERPPPDRSRGQPAEFDLDDRNPAVPPPPLRTSALDQSVVAPQRSRWTSLGVQATVPTAPPPATPQGPRLRVDWPNCRAHGLCHELLPEAIRLDEWGYPMMGKRPLPDHMIDDARRAVGSCPTLALRLVD
jgi:ferredoxin